MARIDAKLPTGLAQLLEASGECGLFRGKSDTARTAVRAYFARNPDIAMAAVRELVVENDDEEATLTLDQAVRLTGQPPSAFSEEMHAVFGTKASVEHEVDSDGT